MAKLKFHILKPPEISGKVIGSNQDGFKFKAELKLYTLDPIVSFTPNFLITAELCEHLNVLGATGMEFLDASIASDGQFENILRREFPKFKMLNVTGKAGQDDFAMLPGSVLIISDRIRKSIKAKDSEITPYDPAQGLWTPIKVWISSDSDWDARVNEITDVLRKPPLESHFNKTNYGPGVAELDLILTCRDPSHKFRRRTEWSPAERTVYTDVMLPHDEMISATTEERWKIGAQCIHRDVSQVFEKYKIDDFDTGRFLADLERFFKKVKWI